MSRPPPPAARPSSRPTGTTYLVAGLTGDQNTQLETVPEVAAAPARAWRPGRGRDRRAAAFYERMNEISRHDLEQAERVSFPITLIVLLLAFTSLVAAGLPIMLALVSLGVTLASCTSWPASPT